MNDNFIIESDEESNSWRFYTLVLWNSVYGLFGYNTEIYKNAPPSQSFISSSNTSRSLTPNETRNYLNSSSNVYVCSTNNSSVRVFGFGFFLFS